MNAPPKRTNALRTQLLAGLLALSLVALTIGAIASYRIALIEAGALLDRQLEQTALALRNRVTGESAAAVPVPTDLEVVIQVWDAFGSRVFASDPTLPAPARTGPGFSNARTAAGGWRIYVIQAGNALLQVAQPIEQRDRVAAGMALRVAAPFAIVLPLLALAGWWWIGTRLRPLDRLARSVQAREPRALEPIDVHDAPGEARPLVDALNALLQRLDAALRMQRDFIAEAAHTLRTPLAAVKLQAQIAQRTDDPQARHDALDALDAGVQRATRLVQQLLAFARADALLESTAPDVEVDLAALAREVVAELDALAHARRIDCGLPRADADAVVLGDRNALRILIENLAENALRYTPSGGRVDLRVERGDAQVVLHVEDSGPGIPAEQRPRVVERFARGGACGDGAGLGLAIVAQIAARHRARLVLDASALGGLAVRVEFPLVATSAARTRAA